MERHITDDMLQSYMDGLELDKSAAISAHLEECDECRKRFETYSALYKELTAPPDLSIPIDFAASVANTVMRDKKGIVKSTPSPEIMLAAGGFAIILGVSIFLVDFSALFQHLPKVPVPASLFKSSLFKPLTDSISQLIKHAPLLPAAGVILLFLWSVDTLLHKKRRKHFHGLSLL